MRQAHAFPLFPLLVSTFSPTKVSRAIANCCPPVSIKEERSNGYTPVNRAARKGNWPGSNRHPALADKILVFTPSMLASCDIKPTQIGWHRQSRTGLVAAPKSDKNRAIETARNSNYIAEAGSTCTPGPMVEDTATRLT